MALGIVSFVMISLLGLMAVGLEAGKHSQQDTTVAAMAKTVLSDVKTNSYAALAGIDTSRYFQFDGTPAAGANASAYYSCRIENPAHQIDAALAMPGVTNHALRLRIVFTWPYGAAKTDEQIFETIITRY